MSTGDLANPQLQDALQRAKELSASSQKRPAGDVLETNPAKRAVMDGGTPIATVGTVPSLGGMNLVQGGFGGGSSDPISEILQVPDNCVGLIIGRKGEQITAIQAQTGCKVQMAQDSESNGQTRQCTLTGDPGAIGRAKARINEIIEKGANRPPPGQGGGGGGRMGGGGGMMNGGGGQQNNGIPAPGPGEITVDIPVPGNKCGLVIGKAGDTIKQLQERSGCHMKLIQDNTLASNAPKPLRVTGTPQKIEHVKQMVDEIISKNMDSDGPRHGGGGGGHMGGGGGGYQNRGPPGGHNMNQGGGQFGGGGQRNVGEVIVPRSSVGMIIGKGGDMIKKLAADTGARIQFKNDEAQDAPERTAVLTGTVDQIQRATQLITDLVHRSMSDGQQETFYMHVPANKTGLVIGKGGETIKQINNESGAHVELNRETQNNPNEKVFIIKGTPYQIHVAKHLICIKVGDIPVGTPVGPFTGGGVTVNTTPAQPQHGAPHHQAPMQQFPGQQYPGAPMQGYSQPQPMPPQQWQPQQQPHYGAPQPMPVPMQPVQSVPQPAPMADWQQQQPAQQPYQQPTTTAQPQMQAYQPQQPQQPQPAYGSTVYAPAVSAAPQQPQAQAAVQTSTASTAAPAINPQTGQPDYSAQWAEYYRSQGMHEQAALIEAQARQSQQTQQPAAARPVQQAQPQVSAYQPQYATGAPAQTTTSMAPTQPASSYPGAAPAAQPAPYGAPQQQYQPQAQAQPQYAYQPQQQQPHHY